MAVVRIRDDLYQEATELAVKATLALREPVKQGRIINLMLRMVLEDNNHKELLQEIISSVHRRAGKLPD